MIGRGCDLATSREPSGSRHGTTSSGKRLHLYAKGRAVIHAREHLNARDLVIVTCTHQANVLLMDDTNYRIYRDRGGGRATYYGGFYTRMPARIAAPSSGFWNIVLDVPGRGVQFQYGMRCLRRNAA